MKTKVDEVKVGRSWMGFKVTAYVDGEEIGDSPIFTTEFKAMVFVSKSYELPKE